MMSKYVQGIFILLLYINCVKACPSDCADCSHSSYCLRCKPSFYVHHGSCYPCLSPCKACDGLKCTSCELGRYGDFCQYQCLTKCLNGCQVDNGNCNQCEEGFYGQNCKEECALCKDELCDLLRCRSGCKTGYYEYNNDNAYSCKSCPSNCKYCKSETECIACNDGFYLFYTEGSVYCKNCSHTVTEPLCQDHCGIPYCNKCQVENSQLVCKQCVQGYVYNGNACIVSSIACSEGCSGKCDESGICLHTCKDGYAGERCSEPCSSQCMMCNKSNSTACQQCTGDYYTSSCNVRCSSFCKKIAGRQTCRIDDGYCLNGCKNKWWGPFCNTSCSSGCDDDGVVQVCNNQDGKCKYGCKNGFTGNKCETILTATTTELEQTESRGPKTTDSQETSVPTTTCTMTSSQREDGQKRKNENMLIIGYVSGIGTILMVEVIILIIFYVRRRVLHQKSNPQSEMSTYYNQGAEHKTDHGNTASEENSYEMLESNRGSDKVYTEIVCQTAQETPDDYNM